MRTGLVGIENLKAMSLEGKEDGEKYSFVEAYRRKLMW